MSEKKTLFLYVNLLGGPHHGVNSALNDLGAPFFCAASLLVKLSQNFLFPFVKPSDRSSSTKGITAPEPSPFPSIGHKGCLSSRENILHSFINNGSCISLPSYHQEQTIPGTTCPLFSSTLILEPGFHQ